MTKKDTYLWCSGPTDQTGAALAKALGINWGRGKPISKNAPLIIGWGTKIKEKINLGKSLVLNHPNNIRGNRNKFEALKTMEKGGVSIPPFTIANTVIPLSELGNSINGRVKLPMIGRTNFHQGGKGMWVCPTVSQVHTAIKDGAYYFQNMIDIDTEYRLHVVKDKVIYSQKKVQRSEKEMKLAFVSKELDRQKALATKNGDAFDETVVKRVLERQAKNMTVDHLSRSNTRGWKFSRITKYNENLGLEAMKAVKVLGLEFGAVDCAIDSAGTVWVIEVNTGPGLEESSLDAYTARFNEIIDEMLSPKASLKTAIKNVFVKPVPANKTAKPDLRNSMASKTALMSEMVEKANDEQLTALRGVFNKMFD